MRQIKQANKAPIRYSEAFKLAIVSEVEREGASVRAMQRKYGVRGCGTVENWLRKYGNGSRGKVIRVERPEEIDERKQLKERVRRLETALADAHVDLALERAYTQLACERAGIADVAAFKKKAAGLPGTSR
jgi:transposase